MQKKLLFLIMLIIVVLGITSCNLIVKDPEVDKQTTIVTFKGVDGKEESLNKETVQNAIANQMQMESFYYQMQYGQKLDVSNKELQNAVTDLAINNLVANDVVKNKIVELGFNKLSSEEEESLKKEAEEEYKKTLDNIKENYFKDSELKGEELDQAILAKANELGYADQEALLKQKTESKELENLRLSVVKDVVVSDEDVKKDYDDKVEQAKARYAANPSAYSNDVMSDATIFYRPAGFRNIKQILIKLEEEDLAEINKLKADIKTKKEQIASIENSKKELSEEKDEDKEKLTSYNESLNAYNIELLALEESLGNRETEAFNKVDKKAKEVEEKIKAGESFESLIEKYNDDPGMNRMPMKEFGYPVAANLSTFDPAFVEGAMALQKVGDVSEPIKGSYGYYILQYTSNVEEGAVSFDNLKEKLHEELLKAKQNEVYANEVDAWIKAADVKIFKDRLN